MRSKLLLLVMCLPGLAAADALFDTGAWTGGALCCFGNGNAGTPSFGQVFTADPGTDVMTSMAFEMEPPAGGIPYQAYIFQWDGTEITGSALYTSSILTMPSPGGFTLVTVDTGAVSLIDGDVYMAMFSVIGDGAAANTQFATVPAGTFTGGDSFYNNSSTFPSLSTNTWLDANSTFSSQWVFDLEFQNVTPEPATYGMVALGIALVLARARATRSVTQSRDRLARL
jgi:hypothetical protein